MTEIPTIRPQTTSSSEGVTQITIRPQNAEEAFFGRDGLTFGDLVDAVNPLNHIPIVSDLVGGASEEKPSVASKLLGGALLGGPIGFVASLANCIFEQATGHGVAGAVMAALSGEQTAEPQTQLAQAEPETTQPEQLAAADLPTGDENTFARMAEANTATARDALATTRAGQYAELARRAQASLTPDTASQKDLDRDKAILGLFGGSNSASKAYQTAQMLPYLKQANNQIF